MPLEAQVGRVRPAEGRDAALDAVRGVGVSAVVLAHLVSTATFDHSAEPVRTALVVVLYLFNVQVLAFVSGYVSREAPLLTRVKSLLVPLACWLALEIAATRASLPVAVTEGLRGVFTGGSQYWFLWALFLSFGIVRVLGGCRRSVLVAAALLAGTLWPLVPAWTLVRGVGLVLPFLVLGMVWRDGSRAVRSRVEGAWVLVLVGFALIAVALVRWFAQPVWIGYSLPADMLVVQVAATLAGMLACLGLLGMARRLTGTALRVMAFVGTATMGVYGFHGTILMVAPGIIEAADSPVRALVLWIALVAVSVGLTALVGRNRPLAMLLLGGRGPGKASATRL